MITILVVVILIALAVALVVAVALDHGPSPADVAITYELARDRRDPQSLWAVSANSLRAGRRRREFVADADRDLAGTARGSIHDVVVEDEYAGPSEASVLTRVIHRDGTTSQRHTRLTQEQGSWRVSTVTVAPDPDTQPRS